MIMSFDADRDYIVTHTELHALLSKTQRDLKPYESQRLFLELLDRYDLNGDGKITVEELALYWTTERSDALPASPSLPSRPSAPFPTKAGDSTNLLEDMSERFKGMLSPAANRELVPMHV